MWRRSALVLLTLLVAFGLLTAGFRSAEAATQGGLVPEVPRNDLPIINDGRVNSVAQIGNIAVLGGNFTSLTLRDGTVVPQANLVAFDLDSGQLIPGFMHAVNGDVEVVRTSEDGSAVFIGGSFNKIDGQWAVRIAKLNPDGSVNTRFKASPSAKVLAIQEHAGRLFIGGSFTSVSGTPRSMLAALNAKTGAVDTAFDLPVTGAVGPRGTSGAVKSLDLHPDGKTLLVAHNSLYIAGQPRAAVGLVDISTNSLLPWQTKWYEVAYKRCTVASLQIRDAEFSPDGSRFVVVEKGGYNCDKAIAFPTADGPGFEENLWVDQMHDSVLSVGASDAAFYVGGHFCFVRPMGPIPTSQAATIQWPDKPVKCANDNVDTAGVAARYQIAALDPATGAALPWNPKTTSRIGSYDLEVTSRGLLHGMDGDKVAWINTGRFSFHDLGAPPPPPDTVLPTVTVEAPAVDATVKGQFQIGGRAGDDRALGKVELAVRNRDTGQWVRSDLTQGAWSVLTTTITGDVWQSATMSLPNGRYRLQVRSLDAAGNASAWVTRTFVVAN